MKGIAILLMVYEHTWQGAMHRHLWSTSPRLVHGGAFADSVIYSFHMASFFFVAGLFLAGSVERRGMAGFALEKARTILYPYVLWAIAGAILGPLTAPIRISAEPSSWHSFLSGLLTGNASWFLIKLFVCQLLALLVIRLPYWAQMSIAVGASLLPIPAGITVLSAPFQYFSFVVAGMWFSARRLAILERVSKTLAWMAFAILLAAQWMLIGLLGPVTRWDRLPIGLAGIAMLLFLGQAIRGSVCDRVLQWYGAASLSVFVLSPYFQGAGREFVTRVLHTTHPAVYLGVTTALAATIPAIVWDFQDRLRLAWLFRWPAAKKLALTTKPQVVSG